MIQVVVSIRASISSSTSRSHTRGDGDHLQLIQPHTVIPLGHGLGFGHQLIVLFPEVRTEPAKHPHDAQLVLGVAVHDSRIINDFLASSRAGDLASRVVAAPKVAMDNNWDDAFDDIVANEPWDHLVRYRLNGLCQFRIRAIVQSRLLQDPAQTIVRIKLSPRGLEGVVLVRGAAAGRNREPEDGRIVAVGDRCRSGVQPGELLGEREARTAGGGGAQIEKVGRKEELVRDREGTVGEGTGTEVGDGVVDCVEGGVFA